MRRFIVLLASLLFVLSCSEDKADVPEEQFVLEAKPVFISLDELRLSAKVSEPREIIELGKIYTYKDYLLVSDTKKGIHIIDNSNIESPKKISFLNVIGANDMAIRNDILYVDSYRDIVSFDMSDINNIKVLDRVLDIFTIESFPWANNPPENAIVTSQDAYDSSKGIVVDWEVSLVKQSEIEDYYFYEDGAADAAMVQTTSAESANTITGQGGSLARFKIIDNYLYAVDITSLHVLSLEKISTPKLENTIELAWDIETIFNRGDNLFIGSRSAMYIFDITNKVQPLQLSRFWHFTSCDPVVVDDKYAYVTLRIGNSCFININGDNNSRLEIINIEELKNPYLETTYTLEEPYGLGINKDFLYVCDGDYGLKAFDKSNTESLTLIQHLTENKVKDVIPLSTHLIAIGGESIYQYNYNDDGTLKLISTFNLN